MNNDEYVPTIIPTIIATAKPLITSPPNNAIAIITTNVVPEVLIDLTNVLFRPALIFSAKSRFGYKVLYSRIRSKITTVSLIE